MAICPGCGQTEDGPRELLFAWMFVGLEREDLCSVQLEGKWVTMVGTCRTMMLASRPLVEAIARDAGRPVRLVEFRRVGEVAHVGRTDA